MKARVRNVKLLVEDLPWAHKPLLLALIDLLATMTSSTASPNDHSSETAPVAVGGVAIIDETDLFHSAIEATGGVTARDAAESFAPALLRPPPVPSNSRGRGGHGSGTGSASDGVSRGGETSVGWEEELAATSVVELLLSERDSVFKDLRAEQANR